MTTICTDGLFIAADSQSTSDGMRDSGEYEKIIERQGKIFALCGSHAYFDPLIDWYLSASEGERPNPEKMPRPIPGVRDVSFAFWVFDDGKLFEFSDIVPYPQRVYPPAGLGSGGDIARVTLTLGLTVREAVKTAVELDVYSGGIIVSKPLPDGLRLWKPKTPPREDTVVDFKGTTSLSEVLKLDGGAIRSDDLSPSDGAVEGPDDIGTVNTMRAHGFSIDGNDV